MLSVHCTHIHKNTQGKGKDAVILKIRNLTALLYQEFKKLFQKIVEHGELKVEEINVHNDEWY